MKPTPRLLDYLIKNCPQHKSTNENAFTVDDIDKLASKFYAALPDITAPRSERFAFDLAFTIEHLYPTKDGGGKWRSY